MRELRTATIVANEVSMLRGAMKGPIVLVEGDSDTRLYRKFMLPAPYVRLTHCDGKPTLIEAMELIRERGIRQVLGICDADFDRISSRVPPADVLHADLHDAEMMIVYSPNFRYVYDELYGTVMDDRAFQTRRDDLLKIAADIGSARMWNNDNELRLSFGKVDPGDFLLDDGQFSYTGYASQLLESSADNTTAIESVLETMQGRRTDINDGEMASGHDFAALLDKDAAIEGGRDRFGRDVVEKLLRVSFDASSFSRTGLAMELRSWEEHEDVDMLIDELVIE